MNIKKIIREEVGDFDWVKEQDPIAQLDTHYRNLYGDDEESIYVKMDIDYDKLYGLFRKTNKTYWQMIDDYHPVKELFSYEDFKNKDIRRSIKKYYKDWISSYLDYVKGQQYSKTRKKRTTTDTGPR